MGGCGGCGGCGVTMGHDVLAWPWWCPASWQRAVFVVVSVMKVWVWECEAPVTCSASPTGAQNDVTLPQLSFSIFLSIVFDLSIVIFIIVIFLLFTIFLLLSFSYFTFFPIFCYS